MIPRLPTILIALFLAAAPLPRAWAQEEEATLTFKVDFAADRWDLSPEALQTIKRAAESYHPRLVKSRYPEPPQSCLRIEMPGDKSAALQLRRANAIKAALRDNSVPAGRVSINSPGTLWEDLGMGSTADLYLCGVEIWMIVTK